HYAKSNPSVQFCDSVVSLAECLFTVPSIGQMLVEEHCSIELLLNAFIELNRHLHEHVKSNSLPLCEENPHSSEPKMLSRKSIQLLVDVESLLLSNFHVISNFIWSDKFRKSITTGVEAFVR